MNDAKLDISSFQQIIKQDKIVVQKGRIFSNEQT